MRHYWTQIAPLLAATAAFLLNGCSATSYLDTNPDLEGPVAVSVPPQTDQVRILPIFTGDGQPMGWSDLIAACEWAEVIVIGELHDDAVGHAVQRAIVADVVKRTDATALALEMLERDEQQLVADYYDGIIDSKQFARLTHSASWAGEGSWASWYQPIIDAARVGGAPTIAANAPRRYVRLARTDGYDRLRGIPAPRRALFDLPTSLRTGGYRQRFVDLMLEMRRHSDDADAESHVVTDDQINAVYRAQMVWDATMAESVVRELRGESERVILLEGQFHCDFNGGTVQEIRRRSPTSRVLTISMQQRRSRTLHEDDRSRADIVIYTGDRPAEREEPVDEPEAAPDPVTDSQHDSPHAQPTPPAPPPAPPAHPSPPNPHKPKPDKTKPTSD